MKQLNVLEQFKDAQQVLKNVVRKTDLVKSDFFSERYGNSVYLKPENMQLTGSYKIRGSYYKISRMTEEQRSKGIITSSAGNHAQGVAYAAQLIGVKATIVMPTTTPLVKINNTKKYGAEVILAGGYYDEAYEVALSIAKEKAYEFVHPFNDIDVATGQGTVAFEILKELPEVDAILVPIGGGGLASGLSTLAKLLKPEIFVIGVEPKGAASMHASLKVGKVQELEKVDTIADGVAVRKPGDIIFPYIQQNIDMILEVDDTDIPDAFLDVMENHKMIVENAGLITISALRQLSFKGKKVVSVLSGGNMDVITMSSLVQHGLINRGRVFTFSVLLPDRPGELLKIAEIVASEQGNIIKLGHNQFVNINRNTATELQVTLEAFGHEHQEKILGRLCEAGYLPSICGPSCIY